MADCSGCAVVHCSAGIGRTGVLLACDIGIQGILQGDPKIDVLRIVSMLRQDRACMVQTKDQYRFIHQVKLQHLVMLPNMWGSNYHPTKRINTVHASYRYARFHTEVYI